jgi:D-3-phosphoglycerate dehydrogenase
VSKLRVLITGHLHESAIEGFHQNNRFEVVYAPDCSREELMRHVPSSQVLVTRSETDVDRSVIDAAPSLKLIARAAVGVGNIDIAHATQKGILVINCPGQNTNSAAELTMGLLLAMVRNLPQAHQTMKQGGWDRHRFSGREVRGKRIGIVGLGNVGHRVAKFAHGFDMHVSAYDPYIANEIFERYQVKAYTDLEEMLKHIDILSVHVPLNQETKNMIDGRMLSLMPQGSYVVNAARGGIIHEQDLVAHLNSGHLAGAAIDTWEKEPKPLPDLLNHPKVWCSPHIGASTLEAQIAIGQTVLKQVEKAMSGGVVDYPVNLPEVTVIESPMLKAYTVLAEKLGAIAGHLLAFNPNRFELLYRGDLAHLNHSIIKLAFAKGYLAQVVDDYVSFVNVSSQLERSGIKITETKDPGFQSYKSALKVRILGSGGQELTIGGVVFEDKYLRLTLVNDFFFEVEPTGDLVVIENHDRPGVIGDVGHFMAKRGVNIDSFTLSRNRLGGRAMAILKTDSPLSSEAATQLGQLTNIIAVHKVHL